MRLPLINMAWEGALAIWGQCNMDTDEHRRRMLTRTFHSSTVRAATAAYKLLRQQVHAPQQKADLCVYERVSVSVTGFDLLFVF